MVGVLVVLWLLAPSLAAVPGTISRLTTGSAIARWVSNETSRIGLRPPNTLQALRRLVGEDGFPQVFNDIVPAQDGRAPPAGDPLRPGAGEHGRSLDGESRGARPAGASRRAAAGRSRPTWWSPTPTWWRGSRRGDTSVLLPDGSTKPATVVLYNPDVDLALLSVPGLGEAPLQLGHRARCASQARCFGHPNGQDALAVQPAAIAEEITALGYDLYDTHQTQRDVFVLAAKLSPGTPAARWSTRRAGWSASRSPSRRPAQHRLRPEHFRDCTPLLAQDHSSRGLDEGLRQRLSAQPPAGGPCDKPPVTPR